MIKLAVFDIDNTLADSRSPVTESMAGLLTELSKAIPVAFISGGSFADIDKQVLSVLPDAVKENLYALPMEGAEMRICESGAWQTVYSYPMSTEKRRRIMDAVGGLGGYVDDRGGSISYHALGREASLGEKYAWDPAGKKRREIIRGLSPRLPGVFMAIAGSTSINFTDQGVDKSFGIERLLEYTGINKADTVFVGDSFGENGNDAPVLQLGVRAEKTTGLKETERIVARLIEEAKESAEPPLRVAYFCAEYAMEPDLPLFAGGLGILAADFVRGAGRRRDIELHAIGLINRRGMRSPQNAGAVDYAPELRKRGYEKVIQNGVLATADVIVSGRAVRVCAWMKKFGRSALYLLDTDLPENTESDRRITDFLYETDFSWKIAGEMVLGIGGVRMLEKLGAKPDVYHFNEGHTAFGAVALAVEKPRAGRMIVATKHTILSGADSYLSKADFDSYVGEYIRSCGGDVDAIFDRGASYGNGQTFSATRFLLATAVRANAVSGAHAAAEKRAHPESSLVTVTNAVDPYLWASAPFERYPALSDGEILSAKREKREEIVAFVNKVAGSGLSPDVMTVVWARRFVAYKRPELLLSDVDKLAALVASEGRPIQFIFSGRAYQGDEEGMRALEKIKALAADTRFKKRIAYIPNYSVDTAKKLVAGADIWLNTPLPGYEACGTSGMKAALNGSLVMSTVDGWVAERREIAEIGWLIHENSPERALYEALEDASRIFYGNGSEEWRERMRKTIELARAEYLVQRMLSEYIEKLYNRER